MVIRGATKTQYSSVKKKILANMVVVVTNGYNATFLQTNKITVQNM